MKHSQGDWNQEAALSSDLHFIRYITADGKIIANVRHRLDQTQEEALANAKLMATSKKMLETLDEIAKMLKSHPEFKEGNTKVHYCACQASATVAEATK